MNGLRILLLHVASVAAILAGVSSLRDSYQDFSWERGALAEAARNDLTRRLAIVEEGAKQSAEGRSALNVGLLLVSAGLLMDGLSSALGRLAKVPVEAAPPKRWHRFCFSKPRLVHPLAMRSVKTR